MASTKRISFFVVDQLYVVARRGLATGTQGSAAGIARGSEVAMMKKAGEEPKKYASWGPDPITGDYKPEVQTNQVEPLLKQKNRQN